MTEDETTFSHYVASSLDGYCAKSFRAFAKHSRLQNLNDITRKEVCFDLVKRLSNGCVVALELKVADVYPNQLKLRSPNKQQNNALIALYSSNVGCNYCYNYEELSTYQRCTDEEVLSKCRAPEPINFRNPIDRPNGHQSLKDLIDRLSNRKSAGFDGIARIFLDCDNNASHIPGARRLFLFHNSINQNFEKYTNDEIIKIKNALEYHLNIEFSLTLSENPSVSEYKNALNDYAKKFANHLRNVIDPPEPPRFTPRYPSPFDR